MKILVEGFSTSLLGHSKQTAPMVNMVYGFGRWLSHTCAVNAEQCLGKRQCLCRCFWRWQLQRPHKTGPLQHRWEETPFSQTRADQPTHSLQVRRQRELANQVCSKPRVCCSDDLFFQYCAHIVSGLYNLHGEEGGGQEEPRRRNPSPRTNQKCDRCCLYRKEKQNHSVQVALTGYLIQIITCKVHGSRTWVTRTSPGVRRS